MGIKNKIFVLSILSLSFFYSICAQAPQDYIAYWNFNEGSGNVLGDSSGNNLNGTIHNPHWVQGINGSALNFSKDSYVEVGNNPILNSRNLSISLWIKPAPELSNSSHSYYFLAKNSSTSGWYLKIYGGNVSHSKQDAACLEVKKGGTTISNYSRGMFIPGKWIHLGVVFNQSNVSWYRNGHLVDIDPLGSWNPSNTNLSIGCFNPNKCFNGTIDELKIFNRTLNESEMFELYRELFPTGICGNGEVEGSEECDDWNNINGDGCSFACEKESFDIESEITSGETCLDFTSGGSLTTCPTSGNKVCSDYVVDVGGDKANYSTGGTPPPPAGCSGEYSVKYGKGFFVFQTPSLPEHANYTINFSYLRGDQNNNDKDSQQIGEHFSVKCGNKLYVFLDNECLNTTSCDEWRYKSIKCELNSGKNNITFYSLGTNSVQFATFRIFNLSSTLPSPPISPYGNVTSPSKFYFFTKLNFISVIILIALIYFLYFRNKK